jgi:hypothetical protein
MVKAKVNGVECTVYDFIKVNGYTICLVKYPHYNILLPVLAELIEVGYETK